MNKLTAFYTCMAALLEDGGDEFAKLFDQIFHSPTTPGVIDSATWNDEPLGPAAMALQVFHYAAGDTDMPPWMAAL